MVYTSFLCSWSSVLLYHRIYDNVCTAVTSLEEMELLPFLQPSILPLPLFLPLLPVMQSLLSLCFSIARYTESYNVLFPHRNQFGVHPVP